MSPTRPPPPSARGGDPPAQHAARAAPPPHETSLIDAAASGSLRSQRGPPLGRVREGLSSLTAYVPPPAPEVKLDANESPWPLPEAARARIGEVLSRVPYHRYPDVRAAALREAVVAHTGAPPDSLILGCGSDELIALLMTALSRPAPGAARATVLFPGPTFVMYRLSAIAHGLVPVEVPLGPAFEIDREATLAAIAEHRPSLVFLASPNNPTGNAFSDDDLRAVVEACPDGLVVLDEAYAAFAGRSLAGWCERHPQVGALGTLSKVGLAAARVGWARLHPELAREVDKARQPYNLSQPAQELGVLALTELWPVLAAHVQAQVEERDRLLDALGSMEGVRPWPSDANFILVELTTEGAPVAERLMADGVGVRAFRHPRLTRCLRITVGTPDEDDRLLTALPAALGA